MKQKRMFRRTKKQMTACNRNFAIMQIVGMCTNLRNINTRINSKNLYLHESLRTAIIVLDNLRTTIANTTIDDWKSYTYN